MLGYTATIIPMGGLNYQFVLQLSSTTRLGTEGRVVTERYVELKQADDLEVTFVGLVAETIGERIVEGKTT